MPPVDPYRGHRVVRLIWIRHLAGQDQALICCVTQQRLKHAGTACPFVSARGKNLIAKPFQADERASAFDFSELVEKLTQGLLEVEGNGGFSGIRNGYVRPVIVVIGSLDRDESDYHLATVRIEVTARRVFSDFPGRHQCYG